MNNTLNKNVVTDVTKLSKGDKLEVIPDIVSPFSCKTKNKKGEEIDNFYIFIKINNNSVTLRNPIGQLESCRISDVEGGYLRKVYKWTQWRAVPDTDGTFYYKTNRKRIWYKKDGVKVKCDCNIKEDKFDLETGLAICKTRWEEKVSKSALTQESNGLNIKEYYIYADIADAPFYYHIVNCINTDYGMHNTLGEFINEVYDLQKQLPNRVDYIASFKMNRKDPDGFVFATYKNILSLIVSEPFQKATYNKLYKCLYEMAWYVFIYKVHYLAMCKICCGKNGLEWDKVRELMINTFNEVFKEFKEKHKNVYKDEKFDLYIQIYDY